MAVEAMSSVSSVGNGAGGGREKAAPERGLSILHGALTAKTSPH